MLTGLLDDISHALAVGWSNCGLKYLEISFAQFWRRKSAVKLILLPMLQIIKKTTPANLLYENYFQKCSRFLAFLFSNTILTIHSCWSSRHLRHLRRARSESTSNNVKAPALLRRCLPNLSSSKRRPFWTQVVLSKKEKLSLTQLHFLTVSCNPNKGVLFPNCNCSSMCETGGASEPNEASKIGEPSKPINLKLQRKIPPNPLHSNL